MQFCIATVSGPAYQETSPCSIPSYVQWLLRGVRARQKRDNGPKPQGFYVFALPKRLPCPPTDQVHAFAVRNQTARTSSLSLFFSLPELWKISRSIPRSIEPGPEGRSSLGVSLLELSRFAIILKLRKLTDLLSWKPARRPKGLNTKQGQFHKRPATRALRTS